MPTKLTVAQIKPLIKEKFGNVSEVAKALKVARGTVYSHMERSPELQQALKDARETMLDNAESKLYSNVMEGDTTSLIFFLKTQGKNRGYTERTEHEVSGEIAVKGYAEISPDEWES